jgi:hypothetical protein
LSLDIARLRLGDAKFRIDKFIDQNIQGWFDEEIVQRAQKLGWARGLSENSISSIYSEKVDRMKCKIVWDLEGPNGEPLAIFLEKGTRAHDIQAKGKLFGGADSLRWMSNTGKPIFRKKVHHPGTKGMKIIERAVKEGTPELRRRINKEVKLWLQLTRIE